MSCFRNLRSGRLFILTFIVTGSLGADDWPMPQKNPQRTAYTEEEVAPPYNLLWRKDLGEPASAYLGPVVCGGKVYLPTHRGNLYAMDAESGDVVWRFQAGGPIVREPCCAGDLVVTGSMDRRVYALSQASGEVRWSFPTREGIWGSPLVFEDKVLLGDRGGRFYCLDASSGRALWTFDAGGPVLSSAAADRGRVFFAAEDMRAYCLNVDDGSLLWRSKLQGRTARAYWPVVNGDMVAFTVMPVYAVGRVGWPQFDEKRFLALKAGPFRASVAESLGLDGKAKEIGRTHEEFQRLVEEYLKQYPERETFFLLDAATGNKVCTVPVLHYAGSGGPYPPPIVGGDGHYYLGYVKYRVGESQPLYLGRLDLEDGRAVVREVCRGMISALAYGACDISALLSIGGGILFDRGWAGTKACDMRTGKMAGLPGWNALTADWPLGSGYFAKPAEDDPGRTSSVAVSDGKVFYGHGAMIVACEGGAR